MKTFIDTSSLFKKYHAEDGTEELFKALQNIQEVVVSPTTYLELTNVAYRIYHQKNFTERDVETFFQQVNYDFEHFTAVAWNKDLENHFFHWMARYHVKSLGIIQLASAQYAQCPRIITSDQTFYKIAKKEFDDVRFI